MQPFAAAAGYVWTGSVFARINSIPGDPHNVLTPSQAAFVWNVSDASSYLPPTTLPAPSQTPAYGMDANGNIGPITDPQYMYSVDQGSQAAAMWKAQIDAALAAKVAGDPSRVWSIDYQTGIITDMGPAVSGSTVYPNGSQPVFTTPADNTPPVQTMTPAPNVTPVFTPANPNEIPTDYLFPIGSTNNQTQTGLPPPAPVGANSMSFNFVPSAFNDPSAYIYMARYPDVLAAFRANSYGMTPDTFARTHYERFGLPERRVWGATTTANVTPPAGVGGGLLPVAAAVAALFFLG